MRLDWKTCFKVGVSAFLLYLCIHYWSGASQLIGRVLSAALPLVIGAIIAYVLNILMGVYEKYYFPKSIKPFVRKTRRPVCILAAFLTFLAIVSLVFSLLVPQLVSCVQLLLAELPTAMEYLLSTLEKQHWLSDEVLDSLSSINWQSQIGRIVNAITSGIGNVMDIVLTAVSSVFSLIATTFISIIFSVYLLLGKERIGGQIYRVLYHYLPSKVCQSIYTVFGVLNDSFHRYIVGQCTEAVILGLLCMLGMLLLRLPYATMIGALIAFTALIPIAGAYIGAGVGAFMILTVSPIQALVFLIFILILQQLEGNLIYPRVVGQSLGLPGIWVLAAVTLGGGIFGIPGMLLGVPLTTAVWKLLKRDLSR